MAFRGSCVKALITFGLLTFVLVYSPDSVEAAEIKCHRRSTTDNTCSMYECTENCVCAVQTERKDTIDKTCFESKLADCIKNNFGGGTCISTTNLKFHEAYQKCRAELGPGIGGRQSGESNSTENGTSEARQGGPSMSSDNPSDQVLDIDKKFCTCSTDLCNTDELFTKTSASGTAGKDGAGAATSIGASSFRPNFWWFITCLLFGVEILFK